MLRKRWLIGLGTVLTVLTLTAHDAEAACRIAGFPDSIRQRLIKQFQGSGCDFDLIVNGRKVIKSFCGQWLRSTETCAKTQSAAALARKCISAARVDGSIAAALSAYDAAWSAWTKVSSLVKSCDAGLPGTVTYTHPRCNAYNPRSSKSTWKSQVISFCQGIQRTVRNFTAECDKRLPRPRGPNEYLMGRSGRVDGIIDRAVGEAAKTVAKCLSWAGRDLYAAAGEKGCEAKASVDHALRLCGTAKIVKLKLPPKPKPPPTEPKSEVQLVCEKAFTYLKKVQPGELFEKYVKKPLLAKIKNAFGQGAARCGLGLVKGGVLGPFDAVFEIGETVCASVETCLRSKMGRITGAAIAVLAPYLLGQWFMGCYVAHVTGQISAAVPCLRAIQSSPALQRALAEQGIDLVCEIVGGLVVDVVAGIASGGGTAGASVASKIAKVASVLKKISELSKLPGKAAKVQEILLKVAGEARKINKACGKFGVRLPETPAQVEQGPPPLTILRPETPPATTGAVGRTPVYRPPARRPGTTSGRTPSTSRGCTPTLRYGAVKLYDRPTRGSRSIALVFKTQSFEVLATNQRLKSTDYPYVKVRWKGKIGYLPANTVTVPSCAVAPAPKVSRPRIRLRLPTRRTRRRTSSRASSSRARAQALARAAAAKARAQALARAAAAKARARALALARAKAAKARSRTRSRLRIPKRRTRTRTRTRTRSRSRLRIPRRRTRTRTRTLRRPTSTRTRTTRPTPVSPRTCTGVMSSAAVNLREKPDKNSRWLGLVFKGHTFEILAENVRVSKWSTPYVKVRWKGKEGYLPASTVSKQGCR